MTIKDLMVGDWVLVKELDYNDLTTVTSEYQHQLRLKDFAEAYNAGEYKKYEPIPLTPEILEKNGWVLKEWSGHKQFQYTIEEYGDEIIYKIDYEGPHFIVPCFRSNVELKYVHSLQHLLKERGIKIIL